MNMPAGNTPLHDPVARDAGEGKPAVLVGSTAPSAGGSSLSPKWKVKGRRPKQPPTRKVVELSATSTASGPDFDMTTPPIQKRSYASVLQAAVEKTHGGEVKATLVRPSRAMLARLMELGDDDTTTDEEMTQVIKEARPYTDREAKGTFWIETGDALASQTNDKIIKSLLGDNKCATWGHLMAHFVQVNKARGGDVVVSVAEESVRLGMLGQEVHILGSVCTVATPKTKSPRAPQSKQQDDLHDLYCLDIVGTWYEFDEAGALSALRRLKTRPLFITRKVGYTEPQTASKPHAPIWRLTAALSIKLYSMEYTMECSSRTSYVRQCKGRDEGRRIVPLRYTPRGHTVSGK
ncbi:Aste57867_74 [Aphanomyces stellatus]|uniref:Aste57867_74 protein n=1 Tax=Aphanomyces stellatus TaxID=120398 RepID=A0A485K6M6_9STRA|nr:hypothetical protein As57867_000074 [Aphanomyces stellatus]VFT77300.1 Aste57867_74 [Aphanomyces stellatus]